MRRLAAIGVPVLVQRKVHVLVAATVDVGILTARVERIDSAAVGRAARKPRVARVLKDQIWGRRRWRGRWRRGWRSRRTFDAKGKPIGRRGAVEGGLLEEATKSGGRADSDKVPAGACPNFAAVVAVLDFVRETRRVGFARRAARGGRLGGLGEMDVHGAATVGNGTRRRVWVQRVARGRPARKAHAATLGVRGRWRRGWWPRRQWRRRRRPKALAVARVRVRVAATGQQRVGVEESAAPRGRARCGNRRPALASQRVGAAALQRKLVAGAAAHERALGPARVLVAAELPIVVIGVVAAVRGERRAAARPRPHQRVHCGAQRGGGGVAQKGLHDRRQIERSVHGDRAVSVGVQRVGRPVSFHALVVARVRPAGAGGAPQPHATFGNRAIESGLGRARGARGVAVRHVVEHARVHRAGKPRPDGCR